MTNYSEERKTAAPLWTMILTIINIVVVGLFILITSVMGGQIQVAGITLIALLVAAGLLYFFYRINVTFVWYVMAVGFTLLTLGYASVIYFLAA